MENVKKLIKNLLFLTILFSHFTNFTMWKMGKIPNFSTNSTTFPHKINKKLDTIYSINYLC